MPRLDDIWYADHALAWPLLPLSGLFCALVGLRRLAYRSGVFAVRHLPVPVVVVGNLTVGGTGKTPLVSWLAQFLRQHGLRPGLVARGYGGRATHWPQPVQADSDPLQVGDEPVYLVQSTDCPMVVGPDRVAAARHLLAQHDCTLIISDDGLQHYALGRDIEIAVLDGVRRLGNGFCLPAGPLRESRKRLQEVDLVVANGLAGRDEFALQVRATSARHLLTGELRPLAAFRGHKLNVLAGIGHPARFFDDLRRQGLQFETHVFPDHHLYRDAELRAIEGTLLMTEKDAVKCRAFQRDDSWAVTTRVEIDPGFGTRLLELLRGTSADLAVPGRG